MGMFGGKKDKRKGRGSEGTDSGNRTERLKRKSRRIVVPNQGKAAAAPKPARLGRQLRRRWMLLRPQSCWMMMFSILIQQIRSSW